MRDSHKQHVLCFVSLNIVFITIPSFKPVFKKARNGHNVNYLRV